MQWYPDKIHCSTSSGLHELYSLPTIYVHIVNWYVCFMSFNPMPAAILYSLQLLFNPLYSLQLLFNPLYSLQLLFNPLYSLQLLFNPLYSLQLLFNPSAVIFNPLYSVFPAALFSWHPTLMSLGVRLREEDPAKSSCARFLGKMPMILPKGPNLAQDLAQDLRQDPGQGFGHHHLGTLDKILGKLSCARTFCWGGGGGG